MVYGLEVYKEALNFKSKPGQVFTHSPEPELGARGFSQGGHPI